MSKSGNIDEGVPRHLLGRTPVDAAEPLPLTNTDKIDLLKVVHETHRREIAYHSDVMSRTFQWATGVLLAIGGGVAALGVERWRTFGYAAPVLVTVAIAAVDFFAVRLISHSAAGIDTNARLVVKVDRLLRLFEHGAFDAADSLYPQKWLAWGSEKTAGYYNVYNSVIILMLSAAVLTFAWSV